MSLTIRISYVLMVIFEDDIYIKVQKNGEMGIVYDNKLAGFFLFFWIDSTKFMRFNEKCTCLSGFLLEINGLNLLGKMCPIFEKSCNKIP